MANLSARRKRAGASGSAKPSARAGTALALVLCFLGFPASQASAQDRIPAHLTGIWESKGAVFTERDALLEGQSIYLHSDGRGMLIGGPPPIGVLFDAEYDPAQKELRISFRPEEGQPCMKGAIAHDPEAATLLLDEPLTRRVAQLEPGWVAYLDERPVACPIGEP